MTTSTDDMQIMEPEVEPVRERSIDELWDLPYSEMSDDEIDRLIAYKTEMQTRDALHSAKMQALESTYAKIAQAHQEAANMAMEQLNALTQHAISRYEQETTDEQAQ